MGKGSTKRPKRPAAGPVAEDLEEEVARCGALMRMADGYLQQELERIVNGDGGEAAEAIRIRKHFAEARAEAWRELHATRALEASPSDPAAPQGGRGPLPGVGAG